VRMMSGFGGGFGGAGSVCGAIAGGVAALGMAYGRGKMEERDDPKLFPLCAELYRRFGEEIEESRFCRDITGVDFSTKEGVRAFYGSPEKLARCARLVTNTAEMVREMLARDADKPHPGS
jgi:C_GCAxxG_C_C family probable redox protein